MARQRDADLRLKGFGLRTRFLITMTASLAVVMALGGFLLYGAATRIAETIQTNTISRAVRMLADPPEWKRDERPATEHRTTGVQVFPVRYGVPPADGSVYRYRGVHPDTSEDVEVRLLVPESEKVGKDLLGTIAAIVASIILVGAVVSWWVANQISRPILHIIEDVRQIAKGDLNHKTRAHGAGGEVELLARSIDRMTRELDGAQEAQVELSIRERELDLASGVREALLPLATPVLEGYDLGAAQLGSEDFGGDFHEFVELEDGRVGLLVCDVSGQGVPAALIGATARAYLASELGRGDGLTEAFSRVNRRLVQDVRRGMFVTALYVLIDSRRHRASVACAGHKVPLLRYCAADKKMRLCHPEGIALGFDKGPVFDRRLQVEEIELAPGDRLILANSAPLRIQNEQEQELGEKAFYSRVWKRSALDTQKFLKALKSDLKQYAGDMGLPQDISLVTIAREGPA